MGRYSSQYAMHRFRQACICTAGDIKRRHKSEIPSAGTNGFTEFDEGGCYYFARLISLLTVLEEVFM